MDSTDQNSKLNNNKLDSFDFRNKLLTEHVKMGSPFQLIYPKKN